MHGPMNVKHMSDFTFHAYFACVSRAYISPRCYVDIKYYDIRETGFTVECAM